MLQKMKIYVLDENNKKSPDKYITLQVNPSTITTNYKIERVEIKTSGNNSSESKFNRITPASLSFKALFDSTGVIDSTSPGVTTQINKILNLCYKYNGDIHEPNKLLIIWGEIIFKATLNSINVTYKLFSPEGKPLRAEVDFNFGEHIDKKEAAAEAKKSSPDISHQVEIKSGDKLPAICNNIYKDLKMYYDIARINKLTDFRNIKLGAKLNFPPLK